MRRVTKLHDRGLLLMSPNCSAWMNRLKGTQCRVTPKLTSDRQWKIFFNLGGCLGGSLHLFFIWCQRIQSSWHFLSAFHISNHLYHNARMMAHTVVIGTSNSTSSNFRGHQGSQECTTSARNEITNAPSMPISGNFIWFYLCLFICVLFVLTLCPYSCKKLLQTVWIAKSDTQVANRFSRFLVV